jgi:hypothetical protein
MWRCPRSMILKLTPAGEQAIWSWATSQAKDENALMNRQKWLEDARTQANLTGSDDGGRYHVWLSGAKTKCGHLKALALKPEWIKLHPKRNNKNPSLSSSLGMTFF